MYSLQEEQERLARLQCSNRCRCCGQCRDSHCPAAREYLYSVSVKEMYTMRDWESDINIRALATESQETACRPDETHSSVWRQAHKHQTLFDGTENLRCLIWRASGCLEPDAGFFLKTMSEPTANLEGIRSATATSSHKTRLLFHHIHNSWKVHSSSSTL